MSGPLPPFLVSSLGLYCICAFDKIDKHGKRVEVPGGIFIIFTHYLGVREKGNEHIS